MKTTFFSVVRTLHAWGGITIVLLMMLVSFTGTLLVWKPEYVRLTESAAQVPFTPTPESLAVIGAAVDRLYDEDEVQVIQFGTEEMPLTYLSLTDERYAYLDTQGNVVDEWQGNGRAEEWLFDLHHRLLLDNLGLTIVGTAGVAMMILLIAGLIAFWPTRRGWRHGLVPHGTSRTALLASHRNLGIVVALPFLVTLVTGVTLAFPEPIEEWLLGEIRLSAEYSDAMNIGLDSAEGEQYGEWLPAMQRAQAVFPGATIRNAQIPGSFSGYRIIGLQQEGEWNRVGLSRVYIDVGGGWMDIRIDALNLPLRERLYNTFQPLHTGRIGALWYKLLLTLFGAGVFVLATLGLVSFVKRYTAR